MGVFLNSTTSCYVQKLRKYNHSMLLDVLMAVDAIVGSSEGNDEKNKLLLQLVELISDDVCHCY